MGLALSDQNGGFCCLQIGPETMDLWDRGQGANRGLLFR